MASGTYTVRQNIPFPQVLSTGPQSGAQTSDGSVPADFGNISFNSAAPVLASIDTFAPHPNVDEPTAFIQGLYHAVLGRAGDASGVAYWLGKLAHMSRSEVANGFVNSPEHRRQQVDFYYQSFLGRTAVGDGKSEYWVDLLLAHEDESEVVAGIMTSPEYAGKHVDDAAFVHDLYFSLLGRDPDSLESVLDVGKLTGGESPGGVIGDFLRTESARLTVESFYAVDFHRDPAIRSANYWIGS